jgi:hypothetical protein
MVDEYMISHYFKRATMLGVLYGNVDFHMKRYIESTQQNIEPFEKGTSQSSGF